jgi:hypothetical protein
MGFAVFSLAHFYKHFNPMGFENDVDLTLRNLETKNSLDWLIRIQFVAMAL